VSGSTRKASGGRSRSASRQSAARSRTAASKSGPPPYQSFMPWSSNQKARRRAAQSAGGAAVSISSFLTRLFRGRVDLAIGHEFAQRDKACIHVAVAVVEFDRVDRAQARTGQFGDQDI